MVDSFLMLRNVVLMEQHNQCCVKSLRSLNGIATYNSTTSTLLTYGLMCGRIRISSQFIWMLAKHIRFAFQILFVPMEHKQLM